MISPFFIYGGISYNYAVVLYLNEVKYVYLSGLYTIVMLKGRKIRKFYYCLFDVTRMPKQLFFNLQRNKLEKGYSLFISIECNFMTTPLFYAIANV